MKEKRIGILGGAFNPPHLAHLKMAQKAMKLLKLDKIIFMPCGLPALPKKDLAPAKDRLEMVKLLVKPYPKFLVSDYEIKKAKQGKKSYTIDTIKYLKRKYKNVKLFCIIGEDSFHDIIKGKWKKSSKLFDLATFVVFKRKNSKKLPKKYQKKAKELLKKVIYIKDFHLPISSTEIRKRIREGKSIKNLVPKEILNYLKNSCLYLKKTSQK